MVKIRLMRMGAKKRPFFRVVVADARSPRDGRFIENIGRYQPLSHPSVIDIDEERALHWLRNGAQPTDPVMVLLQKTGIWARFSGEAPPFAEPEKEPAAPEPEADALASAEAEGGVAEESEESEEPTEPTEESPVEATEAGPEPSPPAEEATEDSTTEDQSQGST
jgi:small subunit ribosomal protein S16